MAEKKKDFFKRAKAIYRLTIAKEKFRKAQKVAYKECPTMRKFIETCLNEDLKIFWEEIDIPEFEVPVGSQEPHPELFLKKELVYNLGIEYMFELPNTIESVRNRYRKKLELIKECDMEELKNGK